MLKAVLATEPPWLVLAENWLIERGSPFGSVSLARSVAPRMVAVCPGRMLIAGSATNTGAPLTTLMARVAAVKPPAPSETTYEKTSVPVKLVGGV